MGIMKKKGGEDDTDIEEGKTRKRERERVSLRGCTRNEIITLKENIEVHIIVNKCKSF